MTKWILAVSALLVGLVFIIAAGGAGSEGNGVDSGGVAVVELFTSQGCSSCPPADRLLTEIGSNQHWQGKVIPLAFHVDYWNRLGWSDPFSSPAWSQRQQNYASAFRSSQVYTPQAVVNGKVQMVGSNRAAVTSAIEDGARSAQAYRVSIALDPSGGSVQATVTAKAGTNVPAADLQLLLAVAENGISTPVKRGENAGRDLRNDHIVRRLVNIGTIHHGDGTVRSVSVKLDPGWNRRNLEFVALLQDPSSLRIYGAAVARE
ncbi:MAG: DUF1223 domain-containing protein [Acidobacteriota bacterium]